MFFVIFSRKLEAAPKIDLLVNIQVGPKVIVHLDSHNWVPPEQFFAVSWENTDFLKKLLYLKIFSIRFLIKKVILIFDVR